MNRLRNHMARYLLRTARGQGLISVIINPIKSILDGTVYLFALKGLLGVSIPYYILAVIIIIKKGIELLTGYLDEQYGFWKAQNWYESYMLNPYNREVLTLLKQIDKRLR